MNMRAKTQSRRKPKTKEPVENRSKYHIRIYLTSTIFCIALEWLASSATWAGLVKHGSGMTQQRRRGWSLHWSSSVMGRETQTTQWLCQYSHLNEFASLCSSKFAGKEPTRFTAQSECVFNFVFFSHFSLRFSSQSTQLRFPSLRDRRWQLVTIDSVNRSEASKLLRRKKQVWPRSAFADASDCFKLD